MASIAFIVIGSAIFLLVYAYALYPLLLAVLAALGVGRRYRDARGAVDGVTRWPKITFSIPLYNEAAQVEELLESILAIDYPADRRQILVVSDASTDRTDEIVREYADEGVELVRLEERSGKTGAEAVAAERATGEIIINTDASIRIEPGAVKRLVAGFRDPDVGVTSGRDVSVSRVESEQNVGEAGYVDYEMKVRDAETRVHGIIGASGCFYAIRRELHRRPLPGATSRDFAAPLHAREAGYRAVSVNDAVCYVPRTASLSREYRRKVRTIERGMHTLWHKRALLNPLRHGVFSWMLFSHKVCRWLVPWAAVAAYVALGVLAASETWARPVFGLATAGLVVAGASWFAAVRRDVPRPVRFLAFAMMSNVAVLAASIGLLAGSHQAVWEPTRRESRSG